MAGNKRKAKEPYTPKNIDLIETNIIKVEHLQVKRSHSNKHGNSAFAKKLLVQLFENYIGLILFNVEGKTFYVI